MFIVFDSIIVNDVFETIMLAGMIGQRELNRWSQFSMQKYFFFFKVENFKKMLLIKNDGHIGFI